MDWFELPALVASVWMAFKRRQFIECAQVSRTLDNGGAPHSTAQHCIALHFAPRARPPSARLEYENNNNNNAKTNNRAPPPTKLERNTPKRDSRRRQLGREN